MLLSIITINYNDRTGLESTFNSVFSQTFKDFEYIVIDGGSSDGSRELIEKNANHINYWVSEKDKGIFNAMNKGIKAAQGDYILFLNGGDTFYNNGVLSNVLKQISKEYEIYYGDVQRVFKDGTKTIKTYPKELRFSFFVDSALAHQSTIVKKSLFEEVFYFNENYQVFGDWEFFTCAICKHNISYKYLGLVIANYDMSGISSDKDIQEKYYIERENTYKKHFPIFYKDGLELIENKRKLNNNEMKLFLKIEQNSFAKKINYIWLKLLGLFIK